MSLSTYWSKRNFDRTAEPRGRQSRRNGHSFVVQKHDARRLHYDFRLELGGVLLSWAIPKGPSLDPEVKRLAMQTEDHPLDYGDFEGVIPAGEYGGGTVLVWDRGTWEPEGDAEEMYRKGRLTFELHGEKLRGRFHLVRGGGRGKTKGERSWLFFKSRDAAARPGSDAQILEELPRSVSTDRDLSDIARDPDHVWTSHASSESNAEGAAKTRRRKQAAASLGELLAQRADAKTVTLPDFVEPQLATLMPEAPEGDEWLHEIKLDGYRIVARLEGGRARLFSRRGVEWTTRLPSIASALGQVKASPGWLDGEVVVLREDGVSDFQTLQNSMEAGRDVACVYFVFDAPYLGGRDLRQLPLIERKELLKLALAGVEPERVRLSDHVRGAGGAFFERACAHRLEGIVSKRADAAYSSGRGRSWLKIKCLSRQEFVIGGYTAPSGSRGHLGALLLGVHEGDALVYAGKVGTGFTRESLKRLAAQLAPLKRREPAFSNPPRGADRRGVTWVEPRLVAEVAFVERTREGLIRHASFQGLREDKTPDEVILETSQPEAEGSTRGVKTRAKTAARASKPSKARASEPSKTATARTASKPSKTATAKAANEPSKTAKAKTANEPSKTAKPRTASKPSKVSAASKPSKVATPSAAARAGSATKASTRSKSATPSKPAKASAPALSIDPSRLEVTNPERVLFPEPGITKRDLMIYYARVARWMLPHVANRPLMLVRCPEGAGESCFHQKHPSQGMPRAVETVLVPQKKGPEANLVIRDVEGLLGLVQMGALEIHTWGSRADRVEHPDQLVFDLDPDEDLPWSRVVEAAHLLRAQLEERGLTGFLRLTGGKGLHIVVPVEPELAWDEAKEFTATVARAMVSAEPSRYVATMTKQKRRGKIFIDYFRNGRGATAVASFSTRARGNAPVAFPIGWDEIDKAASRPDPITVTNIEQRLATFSDPWAGFDEARAPIGSR
jgi:bifunctional non-homologous end joining protein LigD